MSVVHVVPAFDDLPVVGDTGVSSGVVCIAGGLILALLVAVSFGLSGASRRDGATGTPAVAGTCRAPGAGRDVRPLFFRSAEALPGLPDLVRLLP